MERFTPLPIVELRPAASAEKRPPAGSAPLHAAQLLLDIEGMHCASCVGRVESALLAEPGVSEAHVNLATNQARVAFDSALLRTEDLLAAVERAGYRGRLAAPVESAAASLAERGRHEAAYWLRRFLVAASLLAPLVALDVLGTRLGLAAHWIMWLEFALATPIQFYAGWPYFLGAARRLMRGSANMDTLVALGAGTAYVAGVVGLFVHAASMPFHDAAMILTFISLGKYLEARAKGRASAAILKLLALAPPEALVWQNGQPAPKPVEQVAQGETILIRPGDKVPLDAEVISGASDLDEAWLTGEPLPVAKTAGSMVLAGSVNGQGSLLARVAKTARETTLAHTIELVRRAQESKADVQRVADFVVAWFVPLVLVLALATLLTWGLAAQEWFTGLTCMVAVLVVACPCAMGLATPTAVLVGSGLGAERGILIKNAQALETAELMKVIVLDKTGTITLGKGSVVEMLPAEGVSAGELLAAAAAAERLSSHPLARAVLEKANSLKLEIGPAENLRVHAGEGISADSPRGQILAGDERLLPRLGVSLAGQSNLLDRLPAERARGRTPLLVALGGRYLGALFVADPIAPGSAAAVAELKRLELKVVLLSGDKRATAEAVAREVGIETVLAEVKPDEKQQEIRRLQESGQLVAMVGDGINDAPALAAANLGIAVGSGADVAIESADLVLVTGGLANVPVAIRLARAVLATIWQNLAWAFVYNVLLLPLAAGVFIPIVGVSLPPALAAAAMAASSVSVVSNSLLLRWKKRQWETSR